MVEHSCSIPSIIMGETNENLAKYTDTYSYRQVHTSSSRPHTLFARSHCLLAHTVCPLTLFARTHCLPACTYVLTSVDGSRVRRWARVAAPTPPFTRLYPSRTPPRTHCAVQ